MSKVVCFSNQKGGVGKTTSCVNIAASLGLLGHKVLIIDLDPQGNTTSGVGITKRGLTGTTKELLNGEMKVKDIIRETPYENLWAIPANTTLTSAEFELFDFDDNEFRMKTALEEVQDDFDYILIDCPPSLGRLTVNALTASNGVIVPMQCEFYALEGLSQLMNTIRQIKRLYNPLIELEGVLLTMYDGRLNLTQQVVNEVKRFFPQKVYSTVIPRNVRLSEAPSFGQPVLYYDKSSKGSIAYVDFTKEFLKKNNKRPRG